MAQKSREELKKQFRKGARPSQEDFADLIDSNLNIQEDSSIEGYLKIKIRGEIFREKQQELFVPAESNELIKFDVNNDSINNNSLVEIEINIIKVLELLNEQ